LKRFNNSILGATTETLMALLTHSLTTAEMAGLTSGADAWQTKAVERLGIPAVRVADGPHGLRVEIEGEGIDLGNSHPATCFPPAVALGSTWNPDLVRRVGVALGEEAAALGVGVLLGPGINIKRSPLCGRNFEYLSEDPHLTGALGSSYVAGIQSTGVGACIKHFAANNQETDRMRVNVEVDERALREIYLRAFETIVRDAQPWSIMGSYNFVNGTAMSENRRILTDILRAEWGYQGIVMSDWGAVYNRVASIAAGLDLQMPTTSDEYDLQVVAAIDSGELDPADLLRSAERMVLLSQRVDIAAAQPVNLEANHELALRAAVEAAVLLKNDGGLLPLDPATAGIAVIGDFAAEPRFQGAGSSQVKATRISDALSAISELCAPAAVTFARGFHRESDVPDVDLVIEAVTIASAADVAIVFLGLPENRESEGFDRATLSLPPAQLDLLARVRASGTPVVVVLSNGGVVTVSDWAHNADAILEGWLLGQAGGEATARLLFGLDSPSGRLAETVPRRLEQTPSFHSFPGYNGVVRYGEGVFVGYRHYETVHADIAYPFGFGLSYTTFEQKLVSTTLTGSAGSTAVSVRVRVTNVGERAGHEVVQVYVTPPPGPVSRPVVELHGFRKVWLEVGESTELTVDLGSAAFSYWDERAGDWTIDSGAHTISVGASARDIRGRSVVDIVGHERIVPLAEYATLLEWQQHPVGRPVVQAMPGVDTLIGPDSTIPPLTMRMFENIPLVKIVQIFGFPVTREYIDAARERVNAN
jgi:beta-glucosidase